MKRVGGRILKAADFLLNLIVYIICFLILIASVYSLLDVYWMHKNANDVSLLTYKPSLSEVIEEKSEYYWEGLPGQVAWLCIADTPIDFPIMQDENNTYYLNHDPYGEYNITGSIFLDHRNSANLNDDFSMIYGHHMDSSTMFGSLDYFGSDIYFNKHRTGWVITEKTSYKLKTFAVVWGDSSDRVVFNPKGRSVEDILSYINEHASINEGYEDGHIVALSTCSGETYSSRLIVFCMLNESEEREKEL